MYTLKAVRTAQCVPHSFNLPQQISQRHGRTHPKQTSFLLTSSTSAEAILRLKFHLPEEPKNRRLRSHENLQTNRFFALLSNADSGLLAKIFKQTGSSRFSPMPTQASLQVSIERATQEESRATNLVQNNGWNRQKGSSRFSPTPTQAS
ncbi:RNA polymerase sigma factor sigD, chloroplastic [Dorcoceras hygrometricum]|uniref:RNA polymerase sigma factor sigD, chloroplastic n=1 Tax=Dorcoceras hygrometricum TaxID=472368 RepID=A0A2Z7AFG3_9LAMI|nr:RNA polymerase sigma factor sigD, chloroplastic [Dorcoceras hygrometricum]